MRVVFFGTPDFAVPSLVRLATSSHEVIHVVSRPDKPVGRHQVVTPPPVVETARALGLEIWQPGSLKSAAAASQLAAMGADVAVVVAYGRLIPADMLAIPPHGFVNLHPSLLPRHRGPSPIQWALVCGDRSTGVTAMLLDEGMDTGPILLQRRVEIDRRDTAEQLEPKLAGIGADLLVETLDRLEKGSVTPRPQADDGANVTPILRRTFAKVDWSMPARQLVNRLRGFAVWPGLFTKFRGSRLKIYGLEEVLPSPSGDEPPGTVLAADSAGLMVRCGRGSAARITELQREGRRRLPADAFQIGERVSRGERLG
jgi:methionyl-tRNA formyltransferase